MQLAGAILFGNVEPADQRLLRGSAVHGQVRDKRLNENWFQAMDDGKSNVEAWRQDYINKSYNGR